MILLLLVFISLDRRVNHCFSFVKFDKSKFKKFPILLKDITCVVIKKCIIFKLKYCFCRKYYEEPLTEDYSMTFQYS